jgi:hypothetical protein
MWEISYLSLSWIFVDKESKIDLFIVWSIDPDKIWKYLKQELWEKTIKFAVISKEDFSYRLEINDAFLLSIIRDKDSVIPINKLKKKILKFL